MNILKDHNFKCNFSTLNVFTFLFKIKPTKNPQILTMPGFQCDHLTVLSDAPSSTLWSSATPTAPRGSCLSFPVLRTSLAGNLPSPGVMTVLPWSPTPSTGHGTRRLHGQVCLPERLDIFKSRSMDHVPYFQWKKHEWFYRFWKSLRKTNTDCHWIKQNKIHLLFSGAVFLTGVPRRRSLQPAEASPGNFFLLADK